MIDRIVNVLGKVDRKSSPRDQIFHRVWGIYTIGIFMGVFILPLSNISIPAFIGALVGASAGVLFLFYSITDIANKRGTKLN